MTTPMVLSPPTVAPQAAQWAVQFAPAVTLSAGEFFLFCQQNPTLHIERNASGEVVFMSPTGGETGSRNAELIFQVQGWSKKDGTGVAFDSSTGFVLPNGAIRSPDVAWVRRERLAELTAVDKQRFLPLCPDFVIELQSPTDSATYLAAKLAEYIENGAQLGWLINPQTQSVTIYRPDQEPETLSNASQISGEPAFPSLTIDLTPIWQPAF